MKLHQDKLSYSLPNFSFLTGWYKRENGLDSLIFLFWYFSRSLRHFFFLYLETQQNLFYEKRLRWGRGQWAKPSYVKYCHCVMLGDCVHLQWNWHTPLYCVPHCPFGSLVPWDSQSIRNRTPPSIDNESDYISWQNISFFFFCQLHCGCFCAKRIPEDPYKMVAALLRNKPTSMGGFVEPTQR